MKRFLQEYDEDVRHRKKSKTSKTSKSVQRSNHKHEYEKVIIREFIRSHYGQFSASRYMDFRRPDSLGQQGISNESFFSLEEIRAKFPDVPIYEFSYEDVQYHFVP